MNTDLMVKITDILSNMNDKLESVLNVLKHSIENSNKISTEPKEKTLHCPVCNNVLLLQSQASPRYEYDFDCNYKLIPYSTCNIFTYFCSHCSNLTVTIIT